jgi:hypothetical protein
VFKRRDEIAGMAAANRMKGVDRELTALRSTTAQSVSTEDRGAVQELLGQIQDVTAKGPDGQTGPWKAQEVINALGRMAETGDPTVEAPVNKRSKPSMRTAISKGADPVSTELVQTLLTIQTAMERISKSLELPKQPPDDP